jgi:hypothetical protein
MSRKGGNCQSQEMPAQFEQVIGSFLTWFADEQLTMSVTWQISPGTMMLVLGPFHYCFSCQAPKYSKSRLWTE